MCSHPVAGRNKSCVLQYRASALIMVYQVFACVPPQLLQYQENCLAAKSLFSSFCLPPECLQTELLPYLAMLTNPMRNQGKMGVTLDLGLFLQLQHTDKFHKPKGRYCLCFCLSGINSHGKCYVGDAQRCFQSHTQN